MFKSIFFIYILFKQYVASDKIYVHYNNRFNDRFITFKRSWLDDGGISTVNNLIDAIKSRLKNTIEKVSDKVITFHREESEALDPKTLISRLYNTKNKALCVTVGK